MARKNASIFSTLQKTAENASAVNGELVRQLPVDALEDNPLNRFSMAEDEQFLSTMASLDKDGFLEERGHPRGGGGSGGGALPLGPGPRGGGRRPEAGPGHGALQGPAL